VKRLAKGLKVFAEQKQQQQQQQPQKTTTTTATTTTKDHNSKSNNKQAMAVAPTAMTQARTTETFWEHHRLECL